MKNSFFQNAKFKTTAVQAKDYPLLRNLSGELMPEIAVVGRSNVGKSSLLNHFFHSKDLVKTSSKPGKTQAINFFTANDEVAFADLPGYGYAEVPIAVRKRWGPMVQEYLQNREPLQLILFLFDIRRIPNDEDREFLEWATYYNKPLILVLTKVDKVTQNEKSRNTKKILEAFNCADVPHVHYSVVKNQGYKELFKMIRDGFTDNKE